MAPPRPAAHIHRVCSNLAGQQAADEPPALKDRFQRRQQLSAGIHLEHVAHSAQVKRLLRYFEGGILTYEKYSARGKEFADASTGFDSVQTGEGDVQQNQVRLQFLCLLYGFQSIRRLTNEMESRSFLHHGSYESPKRLEVVYDKHAD
jgi:hypothetical protein